ncbi:MAG: LEM-3-like GIY-YIG domain-containing protein, partial [Acidimicrobiales bacterium]
LSLPKARQAEVVLATRQGLIVGAFAPLRWLAATADNFPGREPMLGRFGFVGIEAPGALSRLYVQKRVPDDYRKPGSANPVRYTWR